MFCSVLMLKSRKVEPIPETPDINSWIDWGQTLYTEAATYFKKCQSIIAPDLIKVSRCQGGLWLNASGVNMMNAMSSAEKCIPGIYAWYKQWRKQLWRILWGNRWVKTHLLIDSSSAIFSPAHLRVVLTPSSNRPCTRSQNTPIKWAATHAWILLFLGDRNKSDLMHWNLCTSLGSSVEMFPCYYNRPSPTSGCIRISRRSF